jgi:L-lactate dehydrogenase complex protein LldG
MTGRDAILAAVRTGLKAAGPQLAAIAATAPHAPPPFVHAPAPDLVEQFVAELGRLEARAHRCADAGVARDTIRDILSREQAGAVLAWEEADAGLPGLDALLQSAGIRRLGPSGHGRAGPGGPPAGAGSLDDSIGVRGDPALGSTRRAVLDELARAEVGITGVDVAIAESGTLVVLGGAGRGRLASLLAPVHIAIVFESQIVRGLGEALARLRVLHGPTLFERCSSVTCITGPSRTADIELTLTLGVHGPRELNVIVLPR